MKKIMQGFTLIELMIVVAIIGILAAIAIPQYSDYTSRTRASGAMAELDGIRSSVAMCHGDLGTFTGCNLGTNGIPSTVVVTKNITGGTGVTNGVITANTGATTSAGVALTVKNEPTYNAGDSVITWKNSGTICNATRGLKPGQGDCP